MHSTHPTRSEGASKRPQALLKGDTIAITSTARFLPEEELKPALHLLEQRGYRVRVAPHVSRPFHQFAGTDEERLQALQTFLDDAEVKAVLFARGGYGTVRILDGLNWEKFLAEPKWLAGYSDLTALHLMVQQRGVESLHATMPVNFSANHADSLSSLFSLLEGGGVSYEFPAHELNRPGSVQGKLIGGNLSVIYSLLGSPGLPDPEGCILFLEDLDEYLYHLDRMMQNLSRNGWLNKVGAILAGGLTDMRDNSVPFGYTPQEIMRQYADRHSLPLALNFPAGHLNRNLALPLGRRVRLEVGENPRLISLD